ncbi:MAG: tetratricopeptide repeat protein [Bacteroidia bacterium]|nr:tetratricopeptide repeat protein [Bacteroidia bacterium]
MLRLSKIFVFCLSYFVIILNAQNSNLELLKKTLKYNSNETIKYFILYDLGNIYQNINPDTAIFYHHLAENIVKKFSGDYWDLKRADVIRQLGWDYFIKGNNKISLLYLTKSKIITSKYLNHKSDYIKNLSKKIYSIALGNIGNVYSNEANYSRALDFYFKSLKINEEIDDGDIANQITRAIIYGYIGNTYADLGELSKALDYYYNSLKIHRKYKNQNGEAIVLGNIANIYSEMQNYNMALIFYFKSQEIDKLIGNKLNQCLNMMNIGCLYSEIAKTYNELGKKSISTKYVQMALDYLLKSDSLNKNIGDPKAAAVIYGNIGWLYFELNDIIKAEKFLTSSEKINRELGLIYYLEDDCYKLSRLYEVKKDYLKSLFYYKEHIKFRDSVKNEENQKALIQKEMKYNFEKEQALKEKEHQKKLELERKEKEKQRIITWFVAAGLVLVMAFLGFVINRLNVTRKQKNIIEKQKKIVEEQKLIVEEQKKLVEQKNKDILDSINYAKRIQYAILPSNAKWKEHLPESFVLFLPKDIVAGDFYWMEYANEYIYVAAADCTGHGVPGAMVSVVCSNALTKVVLEEKFTETDQILNRSRELVIEKLTSEDNIRDGMDICLVRIEKNRRLIQFSGANRSLYLVNEDKSLTEIKPDKQPVGRYEESKPFTKQEIQLNPNTWFYLTTDGYADQFGGEKGKKIGTKQFKELLCDIATSNNAEEQKEKLSSFFKEWKGNEEQMDDVTVLGIGI